MKKNWEAGYLGSSAGRWKQLGGDPLMMWPQVSYYYPGDPHWNKTQNAVVSRVKKRVKRTRRHPSGHAWCAVTVGSRSSPLTHSTPSFSSQILTRHHFRPFFLLVFSFIPRSLFVFVSNIFLHKFILETKKTVCPKFRTKIIIFSWVYQDKQVGKWLSLRNSA